MRKYNITSSVLATLLIIVNATFLFDVSLGTIEINETHAIFTCPNPPIHAIDYSPNGTQIAYLTGDYVGIWDISSNQTIWNYTDNFIRGKVIKWSPNGTMIASGSIYGQIFVISTVTRGLIRKWNAHDGSIHDIDWSPDGKKVVSSASGDYTGFLSVWDVSTGDELLDYQISEPDDPGPPIYSVDWSPSEDKILIGENRSTRILDADTGDILVEVHHSQVDNHYASFSPDGSKFVSGWGGGGRALDEKSSVKFFDINGNEFSFNITGFDEIKRLKWDPIGNEIAIGLDNYSDNSYRIEIWNFISKRMDYLIPLPEKEIEDMRWSNNGRFIAASLSMERGSKGNIEIWELERNLSDPDGDGFIIDDFPYDPSASVDSDNDRYPDEWNPGMGPENSTTGILKIDDFPYNATQWNDTDGDGWGDNYANISWGHNRSIGEFIPNAYKPDRYPLDPTRWNDTDGGTEPPPDLDEDGIPDDSDEDIDGDGWKNIIEEVIDSNQYDNESFPVDSDEDRIPDEIDSDDDNDGIPDLWELKYDLAPLDPNDAGLDVDEDAYSNLLEYHFNTSPKDINNFPVIRMEQVFAVIKTNMGHIAIELYPDKAPITVENFLKYVNDSFYSGLIFHRIIKDYIIQAGGYDTAMREKNATYPPIKNEADNGLSNQRGTIAMARMIESNTATSQFYINSVNNPHLDHGNDIHGYCVFGEVISSMGVVDAIDNFPTLPEPVNHNVPMCNIVISHVDLCTGTLKPDHDGDGIPDSFDLDIDNDGWNNTIEKEVQTDPYDNRSFPLDFDKDGIPDVMDPDIDGDGWNNTIEEEAGTDAFNTSSFPMDTDNDTIFDYLDSDIDGDGWNNTIENQIGTNPYDNTSFPLDQDKDTIPDDIDEDIDGDGWNNTVEIEADTDPYDNHSFPSDLDSDGIPDLLDSDKDGDGVPNVDDPYPEDPDKWEKEEEKNTEGISLWWWMWGLIIALIVVGAIIWIMLIFQKRGEEGDGKLEISKEDDFGRVEKG